MSNIKFLNTKYMSYLLRSLTNMTEFIENNSNVLDKKIISWQLGPLFGILGQFMKLEVIWDDKKEYTTSGKETFLLIICGLKVVYYHS